MTTRERILSALSCRTVDRVPLTVYDILFEQSGIPLGDERVVALCEKGLGIIRHVEPYTIRNPGVQTFTERYTEHGETWTLTRLVTPVGEISTRLRRDWVQEYYLKSVADYPVMEYVIRDQVIEPNYAAWEKANAEVGEHGVVISTSGRTPFQKILVDLAGLEALSYHLSDDPKKVMSLIDALTRNSRDMFDVVVKGPGDMVKLWENITGDAIGNDRFERLHLPLYAEQHKKARKAGKLLAMHLDGRLACLSEGIRKARFDIIESFTPAPEGNVTLTDALRLWPGKSLWLTVPSFAYESDEKLRAYVRGLVESSGGQKLVLEIAEYYPEKTWDHHMNVMLDVLESCAAKGARSGS
jgi:hypothetical protein